MNERVAKYAAQMGEQMEAWPYRSIEYAIAVGLIRAAVSQVVPRPVPEVLAEIHDVLAALDRAQAEFDRNHP